MFILPELDLITMFMTRKFDMIIGSKNIALVYWIWYKAMNAIPPNLLVNSITDMAKAENFASPACFDMGCKITFLQESISLPTEFLIRCLEHLELSLRRNGF